MLTLALGEVESLNYVRHVLSSIFQLFLVSTLAVSCLGESGQKQAECQAGQRFDSVNRTCIAAQGAPAPTLSSLSFYQDQDPEEFMINYDSFDLETFPRCKVEMETSTDRFSIRSPLYYEAPKKAEDVYLFAYETFALLTDSSLEAFITPLVESAELAVRDVKASTNTSQMVAALKSLEDYVYKVGYHAQNDPASPARTRGRIAMDQASELQDFFESIENRCLCEGQSCVSVYDGKPRFSGQGSFRYQLEDEFGISPFKSVSVVVHPVNIPPMPSFIERTFDESSTNSPLSYTFSIPLAADKDEFFTENHDYEVIESPQRGELSNCFVFNGFDFNCTYTPYDGDDFGAHGARAEASGFRMRYQARSAGSWGNEVEIHIHQNPIIRTGNINGVGGQDNIHIQVDGYRIDAWIDLTNESLGGIVYSPTRVGDLVNALNSHPYASKLIEAFPASGILPNQDLIAGMSFTLEGGTDSFDSFTYRVFDGRDYSLVDGVVSLAINFTDNPPIPLTTSVNMIQGEEKTITLEYEDTDTEGVVGCDVLISHSNLFVIEPCSCSVSTQSCEVKLMANPNFNGQTNFFYNVFTPHQDEFGNIQTPPELGFDGGYAPVSVSVQSVTRAPLAYHLNVRDGSVTETELIPSGRILQDPLESIGAFSQDYTFLPFDQAHFAYGSSSSHTYELVTTTTRGTLSGCVNSSGNFNPNEPCIYRPDDGNENSGDPVPDNRFSRLFGFMGMNLEAKFRGPAGDQLAISFRYINNFSNAIAFPRFNGELGLIEMILYVGTGTSHGQVISAINNHQYIGNLVYADLAAGVSGGDSFIGSASDLPSSATVFSGGEEGMDFFQYRVRNSQGLTSFVGRVEIYMTDTPNEPLVCQYSSFQQAPQECGLKGCRGSGSPVGQISPLSDGVVYFDHNNRVCYESNLSHENHWGIIRSNIFPIQTNEQNEIEIENIVLEAGVDGDSLTLSHVQSSNTVMIPNENILFEYNGVQYTSGDSIPVIGSGVDLGELQITLIPSTGEDGVGESDISFRLTLDSDPAYDVDVSFPVVINNVSVSHQGWKNIKATGPDISSQSGGNIRVSSPYVCNYSRMGCIKNGEIIDCRDSSSPLESIIPREENSIFLDSSSETCYRSNGESDEDWVEFASRCNISPSLYDPELCPVGSSCIGATNPPLPSVVDREVHDLYYYNYQSDTCFRSVYNYDDDLFEWDEYLGTSEVTLEWEDFTILGDGAISGYNVYRKVATDDQSFDYRFPVNREVIPQTQRSFVDNVENSFFAPVPSTVYHYEIRPIIHSLPTASKDYDSIVRVVSPPQNMAFVHRWIVNRATCEQMNRPISREFDPDDSDRPGNYACSYSGPGATSDGFYDFGQDLLVDRFEAGCNYSRSPACNTPSGDCVSNEGPNTSGVTPMDVSAETIFYNRLNGVCYVWDDSDNAWTGLPALFDSTSPFYDPTNLEMDHRRPRVPPLVHFRQNEAVEFCQRDQTRLERIVGANFGQNTFSSRLPNRKEQMAYTHWHREELMNIGGTSNVDAFINALQTGLSLTPEGNNSKCNSSAADGLENFYTNSATTVSSNHFTLPGTRDSEIRTVITGSEITHLCQSRFGVQDAVGNVAEWTSDQIRCRAPVPGGEGLGYCESIGSFQSLTQPGDLSSVFTDFKVGGHELNGIYGPCNGNFALDGSCNRPIDSWIINVVEYSSGRWFSPLGLPVNTLFPSDDPLFGDALVIGQTQGIPSAQLHNDRISIRAQDIFTDPSGIGSMATGGGYLSGQNAGRWAMDFLPETFSQGLYLRLGEVAFYYDLIDPSAPRAEIRIDSNGFLGDQANILSCGLVGDIIQLVIGIDPDDSDGTTAQTIIDLVNANFISDPTDPDYCPIQAYLSGRPDLIQGLVDDFVPMIEPDSSGSGNHLGFRCVTPIDHSNYDL